MRKGVTIGIFLLLGILIITSSNGCSVYDPYRKGKVIDADTGDPIDDAVVKGTWNIDYFPLYFLGGPSFDYDTKETVTDEDGNFTLGLGPWLYPGLLEFGGLQFYKKGYKHINIPWRTKIDLDSEHSSSPTYEMYGVEWKNNRLYIPLQKSEE